MTQLPAVLKSTGARAEGTLRKSCLVGGLCGFAGISHGYQVFVFLNSYLACSASRCHAPRNQSIVEINPPYIPEDSGWPVR